MKKGKKIVIGNWKMNPAAFEEGKTLIAGIKKQLAKKKGGKIASLVICPPNLYLRDVAKLLEKTKIMPGVQDVASFENVGSKTGSVSAVMARNSGAKYAVIGHSERRAAGETDLDVNKKTLLAIAAKMTAVVCVGESSRDASGDYLEFIRAQVQAALEKVEKKDLSEVIIAYEPVWAIGAKEAMTPHDLHQMSLYIRKVLIEIFGADWGPNIPVLYGGSVTPLNALGIVRDGAVDGLLVGRDSLSAENFVEIARLAAIA